MKLLVIGASGMLGHTAYRLFSAEPDIEAFATARSDGVRRHLAHALHAGLLTGVDVLDTDVLLAVLVRVRPDVVVNCVGLVKQLAAATDPLAALPLNAVFPHRLARLCSLLGARLVHISTDCVFSGDRGNYTEDSAPDAHDLYGRSKLLGEVNEPHVITLRTSIVGRELGSRHGLIEWFLGESGPVQGFTRAIFSGLTTDELTRAIIRHVLPNPALQGVWHISAEPINKHELLLLLRNAYGLTTEIRPDASVVIDRSLNSSRFRAATGYTPPNWPAMIEALQALGSPA